jgi:two-component system chemotaxis response regulator CheB
MIRALLAEDSPAARAFLVELLEMDPDLRVVAQAKDGAEAVKLTARIRPDVVIMHLHMPVIGGLEATRLIMIDAPTPIVIATTSADVHDVGMSLDALRAGALTVLPVPKGRGSSDFEQAATQFRSTVKAMSQVKVVRRWRSSKPLDCREPPRLQDPAPAARILAVAASTGGPAALYRIFSELPPDLPLPILVVQHIARGFVDGFVEWLNTGTSLRVKTAHHGETLTPGTIYVACDDHHLGLLDRGRIATSRAPPLGGFRPSASFLFESVARMYGRGAVGVILTGMGEDGLEGLRTIRGEGGCVIAQDEGTSVVFGMPGAAVEAGIADLTLPLPAIAAQLRRIVGHRNAT